MTKNLDLNVRTPCIGVCSTILGDRVCRGCKRYVHEVIDWNGYQQAEKRYVEARLNQLLCQVIQAKLIVTDVAKLKAGLEKYAIRYLEYRDPHCWLVDLLKAGASQIIDTEEFGFVRLAEYHATPLETLRSMIDQEYLIISEAHYDRYFERLPQS